MDENAIRVVTQWEYLTADLDADQPMSHLNAFGQLGWDLVSVTTVADQQRAYLKRPIVASRR